jgi:hypothetical protein
MFLPLMVRSRLAMQLASSCSFSETRSFAFGTIKVCKAEFVTFQKCLLRRVGQGKGAGMRERDGIALLAVPREYHVHMSFRIELHHHVGAVVHRPQIPLRVEADRMRAIKRAVTKSTHHFSVGVQLRNGVVPAVDHEDVLPRVNSDARNPRKFWPGGSCGQFCTAFRLIFAAGLCAASRLAFAMAKIPIRESILERRYAPITSPGCTPPSSRHRRPAQFP